MLKRSMPSNNLHLPYKQRQSNTSSRLLTTSRASIRSSAMALKAEEDAAIADAAAAVRAAREAFKARESKKGNAVMMMMMIFLFKKDLRIDSLESEVHQLRLMLDEKDALIDRMTHEGVN
jgi:hypothetical protein